MLFPNLIKRLKLRLVPYDPEQKILQNLEEAFAQQWNSGLDKKKTYFYILSNFSNTLSNLLKLSSNY